MATLVKPRGQIVDSDKSVPSLHENERSRKRLYRVGGWAALTAVALVFINAPVLMLNPIPTTVLGHFEQIHANTIVGLINLDLMMLLSEILLASVYVALFLALRRASRLAVTIATGIGLGSSLLYLAVNPTLSFLYLSDQYAAAATGAQRASLLAAGEALWANYQGTAFGVAYVLTGIATLIFASVMLRSRIFSRATAYAGLVLGATMLIPPLPALGTVAVAISFLSLVPVVVWEALIGWQLLSMARRTQG